MDIFSTTARETQLKFGQKLPSTYLHVFRVLCSHQKISIFISGLCLSTTVRLTQIFFLTLVDLLCPYSAFGELLGEASGFGFPVPAPEVNV